ncbi:thiamine phosphate synthase [Actinomyces ruminicola]|uniref:Thiamine-phosphate synthase n=1 Tax=Actinomyces ruminicola TaxID=332524 RepID=A0A1G9VSF1_9ACTO|nr:thiamine phosphate synthase [Actinomyces ruminicola]SDM75053.1 thiamine-phosphate pyrophosphorylase [Actinomyces ruminicola]
MRPVPDLRIYLVTDAGQCRRRGRTVTDTVRDAVEGGATCVQVRDKHADGAELLSQVVDVARTVGEVVPVIVNDRIDVFLAARRLGAPVAGVHVGQSDLPAAVVRDLIGDDAYLGLSAATAEELIAAQEQGACDHVGIGAVRATATKTDAPAGLGVGGIAQLAASTALPCVAIGGVGAADLPALRAGGLSGAAVVSAICLADDPRAAARALRRAWEEGR